MPDSWSDAIAYGDPNIDWNNIWFPSQPGYPSGSPAWTSGEWQNTPSWWSSTDLTNWANKWGGAVSQSLGQRARQGVKAPSWMGLLTEGKIKGGQDIAGMMDYYKIQKMLEGSTYNSMINNQTGEFYDMVELAKTNPEKAARMLFGSGEYYIPGNPQSMDPYTLTQLLKNWAQAGSGFGNIEMLKPSQQTWNKMTPTEQESLAGWIEYTGVPYADYLQSTQGYWPQGTGSGETKYMPAYQR